MNPRLTSEELSPRQTAIIWHIAVYAGKHGYPPSLRELSDAMGGISTNAVFNHIAACVKKGYLSKREGHARTLTLTGKANDWLKAEADEVAKHIKPPR